MRRHSGFCTSHIAPFQAAPRHRQSNFPPPASPETHSRFSHRATRPCDDIIHRRAFPLIIAREFDRPRTSRLTAKKKCSRLLFTTAALQKAREAAGGDSALSVPMRRFSRPRPSVNGCRWPKLPSRARKRRQKCTRSKLIRLTCSASSATASKHWAYHARNSASDPRSLRLARELAKETEVSCWFVMPVLQTWRYVPANCSRQTQNNAYTASKLPAWPERLRAEAQSKHNSLSQCQ